MSVKPSNPKPIGPLRARTIKDMTVRNFVADTQREYVRAVKKLTGFLGGRSPGTATAEELRGLSGNVPAKPRRSYSASGRVRLRTFREHSRRFVSHGINGNVCNALITNGFVLCSVATRFFCGSWPKPLIFMVPRAGIEPATRGFSVRCSTD